MQINQIAVVYPALKVEQIKTQHGVAVRLTGKDAREVANTLARENHSNGWCDTKWQDVRHGLGYLVPLYNNPMTGLL